MFKFTKFNYFNFNYFKKIANKFKEIEFRQLIELNESV